MKSFYTITLLILCNVFITFAWYGYLKFSEWKSFSKLGIVSIILINWAKALFEFCFQVPANKIGFKENGGPLSLWQLKVIQKVTSIIVFSLFTLFVFKMKCFV